MKTIGKFPLEIFCYDYEDRSRSCQLARKQQYCKYIKDTCTKPRKSEPDRKVGICTLGSTVNRKGQMHPVIICPQRFKEESFFETLREKYLSHWNNVKWIQEVDLGVGGFVDYVAVEVDKHDTIKDFLCVEIQAAGTTGTPYPYVMDLIKYGNYKSKYTYGINWANEFAKTMMQQAYKKGRIVEAWNRKIVFVVQDLAMDYLQQSSDCSGLTDSNPNLPVDFCSFSLNWETDKWTLSFSNIKSTSIEGINKMLGGAKVSEYPTEREFVRCIVKKGVADGVLQSNTFTQSIINSI